MPEVTGSVLRLVVPLPVFCDLVKYQVSAAASIKVYTTSLA